MGNPIESKLTYVILDDQSNRSLARTKFFTMFSDFGDKIDYSLSSCSGWSENQGRRSKDYCIQALDGSPPIELPPLLECDQIPNQRDEIPTPDVTKHYDHLEDLYDLIPTIKPNVEILLLIGRDVPSVHHVLDQRLGVTRDDPFAQKLRLGWTIIGDVCLDGRHAPKLTSVCKTSIMPSGRPSIMIPCGNDFQVKESLRPDAIFIRAPGDEKRGLSREDR